MDKKSLVILVCTVHRWRLLFVYDNLRRFPCAQFYRSVCGVATADFSDQASLNIEYVYCSAHSKLSKMFREDQSGYREHLEAFAET